MQNSTVLGISDNQHPIHTTPGEISAHIKFTRVSRRIDSLQSPKKSQFIANRGRATPPHQHSGFCNKGFLADLCDTAIWMDQGTIREQGSLREVLHHYKGRDVLAEIDAR